MLGLQARDGIRSQTPAWVGLYARLPQGHLKWTEPAALLLSFASKSGTCTPTPPQNGRGGAPMLMRDQPSTSFVCKRSDTAATRNEFRRDTPPSSRRVRVLPPRLTRGMEGRGRFRRLSAA